MLFYEFRQAKPTLLLITNDIKPTEMSFFRNLLFDWCMFKVHYKSGQGSEPFDSQRELFPANGINTSNLFYYLKTTKTLALSLEVFTNTPQYKNANIGNFVLAVPLEMN